MTTLSVLLVDDEAQVRRALAQTMDLADIAVEQAGDARSAIRLIARTGALAPDVPQIGAVISDIMMPGMDGFALLAAIREQDPDLPVMLLTGNGDVPMAVRAMNAGAYDFIEKPASPSRMVEVARRAIDKRRLVLENRALKLRINAEADNSPRMIVGDAPAARAFHDRLMAVAQADADVLILGETGTGKEVAALTLHHLSDRARGPFVTVHCGALPPDIATAELFGRDAGAVPGAPSRRGRFEAAEGGIIFLDEIETMPPDIQVRILRVIQAREIERLGSDRPIRLNIRVIAATKTDLRAEVAAGRFRADLFHRLDVARLTIPPLRQRMADVPLLFATFLMHAAQRVGREPPRLTPEISARLAAHDWPGNIRELKNVAERFAQGLGLEIGEDRHVNDPHDAPADLTLAHQVETFEKQVIMKALSATGGRVTEAARILGLPRKTLYDKLSRHSLTSADFR